MPRRSLGLLVLLSVMGLAVLAPATAATAVASQPFPALDLPLAGGAHLVVDAEPFRVALVDADGTERVATVAGNEGTPVRVPAVDGPQPVDPLGAAGAFPAIGFSYGASPGVSFPLPLFTGNRVFGAESGGVASLVQVTAVRRTATGASLSIRTGAPGLGDATVTVEREPTGGARLTALPPPGVAPVSAVTTLTSPKSEGLYGLGARKDRFDQRGLLRNVWTEEQNVSDERVQPATCADPSGTTGCDYTFPNGAQAAYFVQSALLGSRGWAAWLGQSELGRYDLAASRPGAVRLGVVAPKLVLHLAGDGLEKASAAFTADRGRAPAPPSWAYLPWIDRINSGEGEAAPCGGGFTGGAAVGRDIQEIAKQAEAAGIPLGVIGVEGWQAVPDGNRIFADLRRRGYHLSGYWNPFHSPGNACYAEAAKRDLFVKDASGQPYAFVNNRGARTYVIDWTAPGAQQWWDERIGAMHDLGIEGYMHDFGEFVTEGMRFRDGTPPETMHNLYPVLYHQAARHASDAWAAAHPGQGQPWFYVRSGHSGADDRAGGRGTTTSTTGVFPGDESTDWAEGSGLPSVVPAMLNMALTGGGTFSTDVGGYFDFVAPRTSPELLARWSQLAALTPTMRVHNSTQNGSLYPWQAGPAAEDVFRRYARLKVALAPQVDAAAQRAERTGAIGPVRPLVLDDPSPAARSVDDEWLFGRDLLVAPVLTPGATARSVYLPAGARWQQQVVDAAGRLRPIGAVLTGGRTVTAPAPLADIPLFTRQPPTASQPSPAGAVVPARPADPTQTQANSATATRPQAVKAARLPATGGGAPLVLACLAMGAAAGLRRRSRSG